MRIINHIIMVIMLCIANIANAAPGKTSLSGKITDKETGEALPGVAVYFPDLKTGGISKADGTYLVNNLPSSKVLVRVAMMGYNTITENIDLSQITTRDFMMEKSVTEITEFVVTGLTQASDQKRTPTPITVVPHEHLLQNSSSNIIEAISKEPGITNLSSGPAISKPVIRGLGYNRVVVVNDGIRQEGQQWGDEHGIEIDEYSVNKVEILKGPASLAYGSDAMGGVVNMISSPTLPEGTIKGSALLNYQTNNGMVGGSWNMLGNLKGFVFDIRGSGKKAHDYQNKYDGYVLGSKFNEENYSAILGLNKSWGYSHLHLSSYDMTTEITEGERDSASGQFVKPFAVNDSTIGTMLASGEDFTGEVVGIPYQSIHHYKAVLNNSFVIKNSRLNVILGWQQNHRKEFADVLVPSEEELYFRMNTLNYNVRYIFPEKDSLLVSVGFGGMKQSSENLGVEYLIPEYHLTDFGGFFTARKSWKNLDLSGGVRLDTRGIDSYSLLLDSLGHPIFDPQPGMEIKFQNFSTDFTNVSGSVGAAYSFSKKVYSKFNISRGFRSPNLAELASNGVHEGTFRYETGNNTLKAETSFQFDLALGLNSEHLTAEVSLFHNSIDRFIFLEKLSSVAGGDSIVDPADPVPAFQFRQGNAVLSGGEVTVDIHPHPLDWLHFENSFCLVNGLRKNATDSTKYLPFMPAPRYSTELKAEKDKLGKAFGHAYAMIGVDYYFKQDKYYSAYGTETATPGYALFNLGFGTDVMRKKETLFSVYMSVNNLTDVAYQSHLSRLKYAPMNYATGRRGVFEMGRNISFKLLYHFDLKRHKD